MFFYKIKKILTGNYWPLFLITFIYIFSIIFNFYYIQNTNIQGIYTIVKVIKIEIPEQGIDCYVDIYYHNKTYSKVVDNFHLTVGCYYFAVIWPSSNPELAYILNKVPDCLLVKPIPYEGWKKIPQCN